MSVSQKMNASLVYTKAPAAVHFSRGASVYEMIPHFFVATERKMTLINDIVAL